MVVIPALTIVSIWSLTMIISANTITQADSQPTSQNLNAAFQPALPVFGGGVNAVTLPPMVNIAPAAVKTKAWDQLHSGSYKLINNTWGANLEENLTSGIYINPDKSFGWFWKRDAPRPRAGEDNIKPLYPSVRIGGCPWEANPHDVFPVRLDAVKTLKFDLEYDYPEQPQGSYNLAYDFFLTDTNQVSANPKPKAEVMIWLQATFPQPTDAYRGDVSDGINNYTFHSWTMADGRLYYSFTLKEQTGLQGLNTVNVDRLIANLGLNQSWYIHGIELGNEIVQGSGKIEIKKLDVFVNGEKV